jgi:hypothetical protein
MTITARENRIDVLQGTLDMLILQILQWGPCHGLAIAQTMLKAIRLVMRPTVVKRICSDSGTV